MLVLRSAWYSSDVRHSATFHMIPYRWMSYAALHHLAFFAAAHRTGTHQSEQTHPNGACCYCIREEARGEAHRFQHNSPQKVAKAARTAQAEMKIKDSSPQLRVACWGLQSGFRGFHRFPSPCFDRQRSDPGIKMNREDIIRQQYTTAVVLTEGPMARSSLGNETGRCLLVTNGYRLHHTTTSVQSGHYKS